MKNPFLRSKTITWTAVTGTVASAMVWGVLAVFIAMPQPSCGCKYIPDEPRFPRRGGVSYVAGLRPNPDAKLTVKPLFDEKNLPTTSLSYKVTYTGALADTVPGVFTLPAAYDKSTKLPCIVLLHGLGGKKEDLALLEVALARKGYASFAIDVAGHGERPPVDGKKLGEMELPTFGKMAGETIQDLHYAVDYLETRSDIDPKRVGFFGVSLGAIVGTVFVADDTRIKGAVLWAGGGNWGELFMTSQLPSSVHFRTSKGKTLTADDIETVLRDVDPLGVVGNIGPRPLLFINGDKDTIVPPATTDQLFKAAKEPKKRVTLPGGHIPDPFTMLTLTLAWYDENIKPAGATAPAAPVKPAAK